MTREAEAYEEDMTMPSKKKITKAANKLAWSPKTDLDDMTHTKFLKILSKRMGVDLTPKKQVVYRVLDSCKAEWNEVHEARDNHDEEVATIPSDAQITAGANALAWNPKTDLVAMTHPKFLKILSKSMGVDLAPKKQVVYQALDSIKAEFNDATEVDEPHPESPQSNKSTPREVTANATVIEVVSDDSPKKSPSGKKFPSINSSPRMRYSRDLEQGCRIPQAADLSWEDTFFDNETEDLVAVFDHDYDAMFRYYMKKIYLTRVLPFFIVFHIAIGVSLLSFLSSFTLVMLYLHGKYRLIKSHVYTRHMAVARDGVRVVWDDHLEGWSISAVFHCWDSCLLVTRKDETIPFDQITNATIKHGGEISDDIGCICEACCGHCLKIPFDHLSLKTGSSSPGFFEADVIGLKEPQKAHNLIWAMKREKGEQIHLDNRDANIETANLLREILTSRTPGPNL